LKQVQTKKLQEKEQAKRHAVDSVTQWRKDRKSGRIQGGVILSVLALHDENFIIVFDENWTIFLSLTVSKQMERSTLKAMGRKGEQVAVGVEKETILGGVVRQVVALICRKRASRDRRRTPSEPACSAFGCTSLYFCFSIAALITAQIIHLICRVFRYSRGGKEKKAAKRNTSESSRFCRFIFFINFVVLLTRSQGCIRL
jgi:hypothetical protein